MTKDQHVKALALVDSLMSKEKMSLKEEALMDSLVDQIEAYEERWASEEIEDELSPDEFDETFHLLRSKMNTERLYRAIEQVDHGKVKQIDWCELIDLP
ncbi:hypothetical protein [Persicobacter psychrovividus]|uniref:Uncharacterized protein n=1 Tax=Persicobacter psychrovividus TaxID=387638 RepID=A0ABN6L401_9BACT|nr:hypothetical protein PEPS_00820 [Persicobacter psychrovividus]